METKKIIELAGGATAVAAIFGIKSQAVSQWKKIPANRVIDLEVLLDGGADRHDMRPDIFGEQINTPSP